MSSRRDYKGVERGLRDSAPRATVISRAAGYAASVDGAEGRPRRWPSSGSTAVRWRTEIDGILIDEA